MSLAVPTILAGLIGLSLAASPTAATGNAAVIAQHIVSLGDGPYHWVAGPLTVAAEPTPGTVEDPTFLVALAGSVTVADGDGVAQYELDPGEATVLLPGDAYTQSASVADPPADLWRIALAAGDGSQGEGAVGDAFTPGPGEHDLELIRDVLSSSELLALPASAAPTLVHTSGDVVVTSDATSSATELIAGQAQAFSGALTIANLGDEPVAVLAARLSPATGGGADAGTPVESSTPGDSSEPGDSTSAPPAPSSTGATTISTPSSTAPTPPTSATPTSAPAPGDTIDPGAANTTPSSFRDSDNDGLTDAEEVGAYSTNPNNPDTDGDLFTDGAEADAGTDPLDLADRPFVDSDGDGFDDTSEYYNHTDPNEPLSHP